MAMAWQRLDDPAAVKPWFLRGTSGFELVPELTPRDDEFLFDKLAMSAFEGTPLQFALRDRGITTLAICGIALEIGIEPSVRHAVDLGIVPVVVADDIADVQSEAITDSRLAGGGAPFILFVHGNLCHPNGAERVATGRDRVGLDGKDCQHRIADEFEDLASIRLDRV